MYPTENITDRCHLASRVCIPKRFSPDAVHLTENYIYTESQKNALWHMGHPGPAPQDNFLVFRVNNIFSRVHGNERAMVLDASTKGKVAQVPNKAMFWDSV